MSICLESMSTRRGYGDTFLLFRVVGTRGTGITPILQIVADTTTLFPHGADYTQHITTHPRTQPHCVLKWGFTQTFPGNQDATLK